MKYAYLNDQIVRTDVAAISIDDRGFLYGESVFTTIRCYEGVPFKLADHCARLNRSLRAAVLDIDFEVRAEMLGEQIRELIEKNACPAAVARFTVSRGRGAGPLPPPAGRPTTLLTVAPVQVNEALYVSGIDLVAASVRRDPRGELGRHKLGSYMESLVARREAARAGADEAVIADMAGNLLECAGANLFAVVEGTVVTPDTDYNLLPGMARETLLAGAAAAGIPVSLAPLTPETIKQAAEMFITNSVVEVLPVRQFLDRKFTPVPGPVTARLMSLYRNAVTAAVREHISGVLTAKNS